ncbi:hypothetical protein VII00023_02044 [Vibrio ichthyoenteri ATCC 700023]|uniref:Uncharacterized protein n=1 Tax=Vibrio ichthyoenteri ATCC 700023 TaxID=870968 RepID=F9RY18_9VIBR|nr:hypothetical protein VII00023_02044 [Vibrio ichthyoenteri ATCC 700023]
MQVLFEEPLLTRAKCLLSQLNLNSKSITAILKILYIDHYKKEMLELESKLANENIGYTSRLEIEIILMKSKNLHFNMLNNSLRANVPLIFCVYILLLMLFI